MRNVRHIVKKEFTQLKRNKQMLLIIIVLPVIQLLILVYATTFELQNVTMIVSDLDKSGMSGRLVEKFTSSGYFDATGAGESAERAAMSIDSGKAKMILTIPKGFEQDIYGKLPPKLQLIINAEDGSAAGIIQSYAIAIIMDFNKNIIPQIMRIPKQDLMQGISNGIEIRERYWYNEELDYKFYMAPGILAILVTIIGLFLASMSIVREKEIGTIEQLNVTPIRKHEFIIGKLLPFWVIGLAELAVGLVIIKLMYDVPFEGSILLLFGLAALYLVVVLTIGLLISTTTETQQQAMFIAWFIMVVFLLMSGLFTPIDSMPQWAQAITILNPIAHFVEILRRILLKGAGAAEVQMQFFVLLAYAVVTTTLSTWRYRKVSD